MIIRNVKSNEIESALQSVNQEFENNIKFKRFEYIGKTRQGLDKHKVTLTVVDSSAMGGRRGYTGRRIAAACWHAHGTFFDSLPENAEIVVGYASKNNVKIRPGDEWGNRNIGSVYQPFYYSEACECGW